MAVPELDDLLAKLDETHRGLVAQVRELSEAELTHHPGGSAWSPKQQLLHLAQAERLWLGWAQKVCAQPGAEVGPTPSDEAWEGLATADNRPLDALLAEIEAARAESLAWIRQLGAAELARRGRHRSFGEMTVLQMLRALYRHQRMHAEQIAGREPSFRNPERR